MEDYWKIEVTVLDPNGAPYPNAEAGYIFETKYGRTQASSPVDEHGQFRNTHFSTRLWEARKKGIIPGYFTFVAKDPEGRYGSVRVDNIPFGSTSRMVLKLQPERPCYTLNMKSSSAKPIGKTNVEIKAECGLFNETIDYEPASSEQECLTLPVPLSSFEISVSVIGFQTAHAGPFLPGNVPDKIEVELKPISGLQGSVIVEGAPCPDTRVSLHKAIDPEFRYLVQNVPSLYEHDTVDKTITDPSGVFLHYTDKPGLFYVRAEKTGYAAMDHGPVMIDPETGVRDIVLCLEKPGVIQGQVQGLSGESAANLIIAASRDDAFPVSTRTDLNGNFTFRGLTPGRWKVMQWPCDIPKDEDPLTMMVRRESRSEAEEFNYSCTVSPGETTIHNLMLFPETSEGSCRIQGQLLIDGNPPLGWTASLKDVKTSPLSVAITQGPIDREGRFSIDHEGPGIYNLCLFGETLSGNTLWVLDEVNLTTHTPHTWNADITSATLFYTGTEKCDTLCYKWQGDEGLTAYTRLIPDNEEGLTVPAGTGSVVSVTLLPVFPHFAEKRLKSVTVRAGEAAYITE